MNSSGVARFALKSRGVLRSETCWSRLLLWILIAFFATGHHRGAPVTDGSGKDEIRLDADLRLSKSGERRAKAMAAFAKGLIDGDAANLDKALGEFQTALSLCPGNAWLAIHVALELVERGDPVAASEILKNSIRVLPREVKLYLLLSRIESMNLHHDRFALEAALQAKALAPDLAEPKLLLYGLYTKSGQKAKATATLQTLLKFESRDPVYWLDLAQSILQIVPTPDPELLAFFNQSTERAILYGGTNSQVMIRTGDLYTLTGQMPKAVASYETALGHGADGHPRPDSDPFLLERYTRALVAANQPAKALVCLHDLITKNPLRVDLYQLQATLQEVKQDWKAALASRQQVMLLQPDEPAHYLGVAGLLLKTRQLDQASSLLKSAMKRFPGVFEIAFNLGVCQVEEKKYREALLTFGIAESEVKWEEETIPKGAFYLTYGSAAEQAGDIALSENLLKKAIDLGGETAAEACNDLGYLWVDRGIHLKEAGDLIRRAVKAEPDNAAYLDSLGWYEFKTGNYQKAIAELTRAVKLLKSPDADVEEHLGDALAKSGDTAHAVEHWNRALNLRGVSPELSAKMKASLNP